MSSKIYLISIDNELVEYLDSCCLSLDSDPIKMFRAWGKRLGEKSKQLLALTDAIEREIASRAEIEVLSSRIAFVTQFFFFGDPDLLKKLASEGLIEEDTLEDDD
ncbi:MAG: hypothetical protein ACW98W_17795 [Candidatus Hodarchaeales archaeon]|jgi:hypothetical protein